MSPSLLDEQSLLNRQKQILLQQTIPQQMLMEPTVPNQLAQNLAIANQQQIDFLNQELLNHQLLQHQLQNQQYSVQQQSHENIPDADNSGLLMQVLNQNSDGDVYRSGLPNNINKDLVTDQNISSEDNIGQNTILPTTALQGQTNISLGYGSLDSPNISQQQLPSLAQLQFNNQKQQLAQQAIQQQLLVQQQQQQQLIAQQELQIQAQQQIIDQNAWLSNSNAFPSQHQDDILTRSIPLQQPILYPRQIIDQVQMNDQQVLTALELQQLAHQQQIFQQHQLLQHQQYQQFNLAQAIENPVSNLLPKLDTYHNQLLNMTYPNHQQFKNIENDQLAEQVFQQNAASGTQFSVNQSSSGNSDQKSESFDSSIARTLSRTSSHEGGNTQAVYNNNLEVLDIISSNDASSGEKFMTPVGEMLPEELISESTANLDNSLLETSITSQNENKPQIEPSSNQNSEGNIFVILKFLTKISIHFYVSAGDKKRSGKKRRGDRSSGPSSSSSPKLTVLALNGSTIECQLESKSKTVTFKFDVTDINPEEIASNLVSYCIFQFFLIILFLILCFQVSNELLPESQSAAFIELVNEIASQLAAKPDTIPVLQPPTSLKLSLNDKVITISGYKISLQTDTVFC